MKYIKHFENKFEESWEDDFDFEETDSKSFSTVEELYGVISDDITKLHDDLFIQFVPAGNGGFRRDGIIIGDVKHKKDILIITTYIHKPPILNARSKLKEKPVSVEMFLLKFMSKRITYSKRDPDKIIEKIFDVVNQLKSSIDKKGIFTYKG